MDDAAEIKLGCDRTGSSEESGCDFVHNSLPIPFERAFGTFMLTRTLLPQAAAMPHLKRRTAMLGWAVTFLIIALTAALLGFGVIAGVAIEAAKIVFFVAIVLFAISVIAGLVRGRPTVP